MKLTKKERHKKEFWLHHFTIKIIHLFLKNVGKLERVKDNIYLISFDNFIYFI